MTLAVHFQNDKIQVSRSRASQSELVMFDDTDFLPTEFTMTADTARPRIATTDCDTQRIVKLHVEADGMEIHLTGTNADDIPVDAVLRGLFETIRATDDSDEIVIVGAENKLLERMAIASGFSGTAFISPAEAAIRWAGADTYGAAAVLFCNQDGSLAWQYTIFNDEGYLIRHRSDQFTPTDPTRIDHGFGKFLVSLDEQASPVAQIIVTGSGAETESVKPFLSAIESQYRYQIQNNANAVVLGAAMPPLKSKYAEFDNLIAAALDALSNAEFAKAMETFAKATTLFESPSEPIKQTTDHLRHLMRTAILAAPKSQKTVEAERLSEMALALSETDPEKAAVYNSILNLSGQAGNIAAAETAAITAAFYDPDNEKHYMETLRSYQDDAGGDDTLHSDNTGSKRASVWLGLLSACEAYFFIKTLFP